MWMAASYGATIDRVRVFDRNSPALNAHPAASPRPSRAWTFLLRWYFGYSHRRSARCPRSSDVAQRLRYGLSRAHRGGLLARRTYQVLPAAGGKRTTRHGACALHRAIREHQHGHSTDAPRRVPTSSEYRSAVRDGWTIWRTRNGNADNRVPMAALPSSVRVLTAHRFRRNLINRQLLNDAQSKHLARLLHSCRLGAKWAIW